MSIREDKRKANEDAVLAAIAKFDGLDYGASYRDIADATGLGLGTVFDCVSALVAEGVVTKTPILARSIRRVQ